MVRNARWVKDNIVLLGDAKATAHFSIGAGTKLAMEDANSLHDALAKTRTVREALAAFESGRREEVERTQHSADVSLVFFEHLGRFWNFDPVQFAFGVMTRAKAITYDNLHLRAPEFVADVDRHFADGVAGNGFAVDTAKPKPPMFQPFRLRDMTLANRVVVSPMCMYSAEDGVPGDWHLVHYGARAVSGAGLMFTEMTDIRFARQNRRLDARAGFVAGQRLPNPCLRPAVEPDVFVSGTIPVRTRRRVFRVWSTRGI
jgi:anthraniloyl-CoA monooxygenase